MKVLCVFGTRPEAIKMAPVLMELQKHSDFISTTVCVTAQHREMLDSVLELFDIKANHDLDIMENNQGLSALTANVFTRVDPVIAHERPDWVLVQGDTTTVMAATLTAFYHRVKVGHIEAGLRTWNKFHPFPEEVNRKIVDSVCDLHFAPTETARKNLLREGVRDESIRVTGNTIVDALQIIGARTYDWLQGPLRGIRQDGRLILVTAHRRENFGEPLKNIFRALVEIATRYPDVHIVYPVHMNPNVLRVATTTLSNVPNITLLRPLDYLSMVQLMKRAVLVLTDSGGLQEEMPTFGKPVLVLRETTERPEAVIAGTATVVGTSTESIVQHTSRILDTDGNNRAVNLKNPFGDGHASERIVRALVEFSA